MAIRRPVSSKPNIEVAIGTSINPDIKPSNSLERTAAVHHNPRRPDEILAKEFQAVVGYVAHLLFRRAQGRAVLSDSRQAAVDEGMTRVSPKSRDAGFERS
jgi:hypothetical protein